jgi:hypothetical protein
MLDWTRPIRDIKSETMELKSSSREAFASELPPSICTAFSSAAGLGTPRYL